MRIIILIALFVTPVMAMSQKEYDRKIKNWYGRNMPYPAITERDMEAWRQARRLDYPMGGTGINLKGVSNRGGAFSSSGKKQSSGKTKSGKKKK